MRFAFLIFLLVAASIARANESAPTSPLVGTPLYVLAEPDSDATAFEERKLTLVEIRPADEDQRFFSGGQTLAHLIVPLSFKVEGFALAGFKITPEYIKAEAVYILESNARLWRASLENTKNGTPRPSLELIAGRFTCLMSEAAGLAFVIDEQNRLTPLTGDGPWPAESRLPLQLAEGEKAVRLSPWGQSKIAVLTNLHRVLPIDLRLHLKILPSFSLSEFALPPELQSLSPTTWDVRGDVNSGDFWVVDEASRKIWIKAPVSQRGMAPHWFAYDLSGYLHQGRHGQNIKVLGHSSDALFFQAGSHYLMIQRRGPSPRAMALMFLAQDYFTAGLRLRGVVADLTTTVHILQPSTADRTSLKRRDLQMRDLKFDRKSGILEFISPGARPFSGPEFSGAAKRFFFDQFMSTSGENLDAVLGQLLRQQITENLVAGYGRARKCEQSLRDAAAEYEVARKTPGIK